jgi:uncharacterized protein (DUF2336 family)
MIGLLQRVFGKSRAKPIAYDESKRLSASTDPAERRRVATHDGVRPELLYFLANDPDPSVRAAVAANQATPVQADLLLARDRDDAVRQDLARKIARLAPGLTAQEQDRLRRSTYEVLEILVRDQIVKVRQIIAETLQDVVDAPPEIIRLLARDYEIAVAGPVLQFSPLLDDADLIEIIGHSPIAGALEAVARRQPVTDTVADAVGASGNVAAITALLENSSAQIREETLNRLIDAAPEHRAWHRPLVRRPRLPPSGARKLAQFVAANLLGELRARRDLDPRTTDEIASIVMRRLAEDGEAEPEAADGKAANGHGNGADKASAADAALERAKRMHAAGTLDDEAVTSALQKGDRGFVRAALSVRADLPLESIDKVVGSRSAKGIVALAFQAKLEMRTAVRLQTILGHIAMPAVIKPRSDGGYPMTEDAIRWQLDFLTGTTVSPAR